MSDRLFRDEIMSSPRYWSLSSDTGRMLFFHLCFIADDFGIFRAANYTIRQQCFGADTRPSPEVLARILAELQDADLIRLYQFDGADYGFIPRFRQRLRIMKSKHPFPPPEIRDSAINELIAKMSDGCLTAVGQLTAEVKRSEAKGREGKKNANLAGAPNGNAGPLADVTGQDAVENIAGQKSFGQNWKNSAWVLATAKTVGVTRREGEDTAAFRDRVYAAVQDRVAKAAQDHKG